MRVELEIRVENAAGKMTAAWWASAEAEESLTGVHPRSQGKNTLAWPVNHSDSLEQGRSQGEGDGSVGRGHEEMDRNMRM